jgi:initiation factor 1A
MPKADKKKKNASQRKVHKDDKNADGSNFQAKNEGEEYGILIKFTGGGYVNVKCADAKSRRCHIRGKLQKYKSGKSKLEVGDIVLVALRTDINNDQGDVLLKYDALQVKCMRKEGLLQALDSDLDSDEHKSRDHSSLSEINNMLENFDFETL